jgi:hypothetical protein
MSWLNPLNAKLNPICHLLILLGDLTFESVHRKYILIYIQQDAMLRSLFISGNYSTRFGWYFHPSSGAHTPVSTTSGICHTVTAICRYRRRGATGLSVLWVAYATYIGILLAHPILHISRIRVNGTRFFFLFSFDDIQLA